MPLRGLPQELLVGTETADDAAVYRLNDTQALVATTDFFTPVVDDPYDFGRIAATNAISDIYAMGARPIMALALVGMPLEKLPVSVIRKVLEGGESVCAQAGIPVAGGHSIDTLEPIYGLVALGLVHPDKVKRNSSGKAGDVLILGKPLGIGILSALVKKGKISAAGYAQMLDWTTRLNTPGEALGAMTEVHAITDVTGFGLAGHLLEMCRGSGLGAEVRLRCAAGHRRGARLGEAGRRHRRFGAQLEGLRPRSRFPGRRLEAQAALGSANQRRAAGGLRAGGEKAVLRDFEKQGFAEARAIGRLVAGPPRLAVTVTASVPARRARASAAARLRSGAGDPAGRTRACRRNPRG